MFDSVREVAMTPQAAWDELVDWAGHSAWVPLTHVEVDPNDPARFTAWSGPGAARWGRRLSLRDEMVAVEMTFNESRGRCRVHKLGPILVGFADLTVTPGSQVGHTRIQWHEEVHVKFLPRLFTVIVGKLSAALFRSALGRMERLAHRQH